MALNVVIMEALFCAATSLRAMVSRRFDMRSRRSLRLAGVRCCRLAEMICKL